MFTSVCYVSTLFSVAKDFKSESNVCLALVLHLVTSSDAATQCIVANMDADAALNKEIAGRYGVASYPTIKFFPRGGKEVESYEEARSEQAFVTFLNERCGTYRAVGGGLNDEVSVFGFNSCKLN